MEIHQTEHAAQDMCFCGGRGPDNLIDSTVVFMHRTVVDFLDTEAAWRLECLNIQDELFDPAAALSCMWLYLAQVGARDTHIDSCISRSLYYGSCADSSMPGSMTPVLSKLRDLLQHIKGSLVGHFANIIAPDTDHDGQAPRHIAVVLAVEAGILEFVRSYGAKHNVKLSARLGRFPLLYHAIKRPFFNSMLASEPSSWMPVSTQMIEFLLSCGCRPYERFQDAMNFETTPWEVWMSEMTFNKRLGVLQKVQTTDQFVVSGINSETLTIMGADVEEVRTFLTRTLVDFPRSPDMKSRVEEMLAREKGSAVYRKFLKEEDRREQLEGPSAKRRKFESP